MKRFASNFLAISFAVIAVLSSCSKEKPEPGPTPGPEPENINFALSGVGVSSAKLEISVKGGLSFYGGIKLIRPGESVEGLADIFLRDASAVIVGYEKPVWNDEKEDFEYEHVFADGEYGVNFEAEYKGDINKFAVHDNGEGKKEPRLVYPGATYAVAVIPYSETTDYEKMTSADVMVEYVKLTEPKAITTAIATFVPGETTVISAAVAFDITAAVSRLYYAFAPKTEFDDSGLSEYEFALYNGAVWDRATIEATGAVSGIAPNPCTMLAPGQKCVAMAVALNKSGEYFLCKGEISSKDVEKTSGSLTLDAMTTEPGGATYSWVNVAYTASTEIVQIRYIHASEKLSDPEVYGTLTTGAMWDYDSVNVRNGEAIRYTIDPLEAEDQIVYAVGVDSDNKFTDLLKITPEGVIPPAHGESYTVNFSGSAKNCHDANISVSIKEGVGYYGGLMLVTPGMDKSTIAQIFYEDASPVIAGYESGEKHVYGDGEFGVAFTETFSGNLTKFALHDNGDGKKEDHLLISGAEYAIGILPYDSSKDDYEGLSAANVTVKFVQLTQLQNSTTGQVTVTKGDCTTNSASAVFGITAGVTRFYYTVVSKSDFEKSGMTDMQYALYKGAMWDRAVSKATGPVNDFTDNATLLSPGEECYAIAVGVLSSGSYQMVKLSVFAEEVQLSSATLTLTGISANDFSANSKEMVVSYTYTGNLVDVRYIYETKGPDMDTDAEFFNTLTTGSSWDYKSVKGESGNLGDPIKFYCAPEDAANQVVFAVGVDSDGKFTTLQKIESK